MPIQKRRRYDNDSKIFTNMTKSLGGEEEKKKGKLESYLFLTKLTSTRKISKACMCNA